MTKTIPATTPTASTPSTDPLTNGALPMLPTPSVMPPKAKALRTKETVSKRFFTVSSTFSKTASAQTSETPMIAMAR